MTTPAQPDPAAEMRAAAQRLYTAAVATQKEMATEYYWQGVPAADAWKLGIKDALASAPGEYAALLTPEAGIAIAALLFQCAMLQQNTQDVAHRNWAQSSDAVARDRYIAAHTDDRALAVARALLGGAE